MAAHLSFGLLVIVAEQLLKLLSCPDEEVVREQFDYASEYGTGTIRAKSDILSILNHPPGHQARKRA